MKSTFLSLLVLASAVALLNSEEIPTTTAGYVVSEDGSFDMVLAFPAILKSSTGAVDKSSIKTEVNSPELRAVDTTLVKTEEVKSLKPRAVDTSSIETEEANSPEPRSKKSLADFLYIWQLVDTPFSIPGIISAAETVLVYLKYISKRASGDTRTGRLSEDHPVAVSFEENLSSIENFLYPNSTASLFSKSPRQLYHDILAVDKKIYIKAVADFFDSLPDIETESAETRTNDEKTSSGPEKRQHWLFEAIDAVWKGLRALSSVIDPKTGGVLTAESVRPNRIPIRTPITSVIDPITGGVLTVDSVRPNRMPIWIPIRIPISSVIDPKTGGVLLLTADSVRPNMMPIRRPKVLNTNESDAFAKSSTSNRTDDIFNSKRQSYG